MTSHRWRADMGRRVFGLGLMALATVALVWGDFDPGQPVPKGFPDRTALAYAVSVCIFLAGAAVQWRRTAPWGAAAVAVYYGVFVVGLMNGRLALAHPDDYGAYSGGAEQLAIAAAALIVFTVTTRIGPALAARLGLIGRLTVGVCVVLFGGAHFVYMGLTAPLVPKWLPPSQVFWGYATGVAQLAAGVAIITGVRARLAAVLLTVMYLGFTGLVHVPMLWADPASRWIWSENALNIALIGVTWMVADSLAGRRPRRFP